MRGLRNTLLSVLAFGGAVVAVIAAVKNFLSPELHERLLWSPLIEHRGRLSLLLARIRARKHDKDTQTLQETGVIALMTIFDLLLSRDQHYKYLWIQEQREKAAAANGANGAKTRVLPE